MTTKYSINPELAWRIIDNEAVILKVKTTTYYSLDPVGTFIWTLMEKESRSKEELLADLRREFDVAPDVAQTDLDELFSDLSREGLVLESAA